MKLLLALSLLTTGCVTKYTYASEDYMLLVRDLCNKRVKEYNPRTGEVICKESDGGLREN